MHAPETENTPGFTKTEAVKLPSLRPDYRKKATEDDSNQDRAVSNPQTQGFSRGMYTRMTEFFYLHEIDFAKPVLATLLYTDKTKAPTPGQVKRHKQALVRNFETGWGVELRGIWKDEVSSAGIPHTHIYMDAPEGVATGHPSGANGNFKFQHLNGLAFPEWLAGIWEIITKQEPVERMPVLGHVSEDHRPIEAIQTYLGKQNGKKSYQNGPIPYWKGRYSLWGVFGTFEERSDLVTVTLQDEADFLKANARLNPLAEREREAVDLETGEIKTWTPGRRFRSKAGRGGFHVGPGLTDEVLALRASAKVDTRAVKAPQTAPTAKIVTEAATKTAGRENRDVNIRSLAEAVGDLITVRPVGKPQDKRTKAVVPAPVEVKVEQVEVEPPLSREEMQEELRYWYGAPEKTYDEKRDKRYMIQRLEKALWP